MEDTPQVLVDAMEKIRSALRDGMDTSDPQISGIGNLFDNFSELLYLNLPSLDISALQSMMYTFKSYLNTIKHDHFYDLNYLITSSLISYIIYNIMLKSSETEKKQISTAILLSELILGLPQLPEDIRKRQMGIIENRLDYYKITVYLKFLETSSDVYYNALSIITIIDQDTYIQWIRTYLELIILVIERVEKTDYSALLDAEIISKRGYANHHYTLFPFYLNPFSMIVNTFSALPRFDHDILKILPPKIGNDLKSIFGFLKSINSKIRSNYRYLQELENDGTIEDDFKNPFMLMIGHIGTIYTKAFLELWEAIINTDVYYLEDLPKIRQNIFLNRLLEIIPDFLEIKQYLEHIHEDQNIFESPFTQKYFEIIKTVLAIYSLQLHITGEYEQFGILLSELETQMKELDPIHHQSHFALIYQARYTFFSHLESNKRLFEFNHTMKHFIDNSLKWSPQIYNLELIYSIISAIEKNDFDNINFDSLFPIIEPRKIIPQLQEYIKIIRNKKSEFVDEHYREKIALFDFNSYFRVKFVIDDQILPYLSFALSQDILVMSNDE
ncbi:MAG: hypothetical protein INQ03_22905 [Candidatus Heimdallarchaeota archaeon]|nr:hypothetical protein [Candidatus Heimdallarchaeota archaeon]